MNNYTHNQENDAPKSSNRILAVDSQNVNALIIDDEPGLAKVLARSIRNSFAEVFVSTKTDEGLDIITTKLVPHSLIISDHHNQLSPFHGAELAKRTETIRTAKKLPFYLMSGGLGAKEFTEVQELIARKIITGFIEKPVTIVELRELVGKLYLKRTI